MKWIRSKLTSDGGLARERGEVSGRKGEKVKHREREKIGKGRRGTEANRGG